MANESLIQVFEGKNIRIVWNEEEEKYYFAVADIVQVLTDSADAKQYIKRMRSRDPELDFRWGTICTPTRMRAADSTTDRAQNVAGHVADKLTERQQVILAIIRQFVVDHVADGVVEDGVEIPSANSMSKQLNTSSRTIQRELAYLRTKGRIRRKDGDFGGYWEIIDKADK